MTTNMRKAPTAEGGSNLAKPSGERSDASLRGWSPRGAGQGFLVGSRDARPTCRYRRERDACGLLCVKGEACDGARVARRVPPIAELGNRGRARNRSEGATHAGGDRWNTSGRNEMRGRRRRRDSRASSRAFVGAVSALR